MTSTANERDHVEGIERGSTANISEGGQQLPSPVKSRLKKDKSPPNVSQEGITPEVDDAEDGQIKARSFESRDDEPLTSRGSADKSRRKGVLVDWVVKWFEPSTNKVPESYHWFNLILLLIYPLAFSFDLATDISVTILHFNHNDYWYFALTLTFIVVPGLVMNGLSLLWYISDARQHDPEVSAPPTRFVWVVRAFYLLIQIGPLIRHLDCLRFAVILMTSSGKETRRQYYKYLVYEETDALLLHLLEAFMEAAPQLVLQIYILAQQHKDINRFNDMMTNSALLQMLGCVASLFTMAWGLVNYSRFLRESLPGRQNMTILGILVQFLWRICTITARVIALGLFASLFEFYTTIVCLVHWLLMLFWLIIIKSSKNEKGLQKLGYSSILAFMFIFDYYNPVGSPAKCPHIVYYVVMFFENTILIGVWFLKSDPNIWYKCPATVIHFVAFFLGFLFMLIYYLLMHPKEEDNEGSSYRLRFMRKIETRIHSKSTSL